MADVVAEQVNKAHAFEHVGLDYCGPFNVKRFPGRCKSLEKNYVAVFVCMITRGVHLEVVRDLTTDAFLAAYHRFTSRRGRCLTISSDNGRTFLGAQRKLSEVEEAWRECSTLKFFTDNHVTWRFIAPRAPHQGGLWETTVKSFKHHLRRTMGTTTLANDAFVTLVTRIEGCLNSRPLGIQFDDVNDAIPVTPAQLIIGKTIFAEPDEEITDERLSRTSTWRQVQHLHQW